MNTADTIRRIRTVFSAEGVEQTVGAMHRYERAQEGIVATSSTAERASLSLDRSFANLERRYVAGVRQQQDYEKVQRQVNAAVSQNPALQERANAILTGAEAKLKTAATANDNFAKSTGLAKYELINLSRQVQDIGVSLASGQSPFTVLVQQGTQVADIFSSSQGTARGFASQIASMITPMRALGLGVAAVGAAALAGFGYWKSYATTLDDLSRSVGVATTQLSSLQSAAGVKGIGTADFSSGIKQFASNVFEAKAGANDLVRLFDLNNKKVTDTAGTLNTLADLIRRAKDDQQRLVLLQQAGLPATMDWVRLLRDGADGLRSATEDATKFGGAVNDQMVAKAREFDEAWNRAWTNFGVRSRSAVTDIVSALSRAVSGAEDLVAKFKPDLAAESARDALKRGVGSRLNGSDADTFYGAFGKTFSAPSGTTKDLTDLAAQQRALQMEQQRLSLLGELATADEKVRLAEIQIIQARQQPGSLITDTDVKRIEDYARAQELLSRDQQRLSYLGTAATDAEKYTVRVRELELALKAGKIAQDDFNRALAYANPLFAGFANSLDNNLTTGLMDIVSGTKSVKESFADMAEAIFKDLQKMIIQLLVVRPLLNGLAGFVGGGLSGGAGAPLSITPSAYGNAFLGGNVIPFARGGIVNTPTIFPMASGAGLMGEAGPEAVMPLRRGQDGKLGVAAAGGGKMIVNVINNAGSDIKAQPQAQRQNSDGSVSIDVVIERAVRNAVNSDVANNGPMIQGIARRLGANTAAGIA